jgi:hypothetical protein
MLRSRSLVPLAVLALSACQPPAGGTTAGEESSGGMMEGTGSSGQVPTTSSASGSSGAQEGCPAGCGADEACIDGTCEAVGRADIEAGCHPLGDPQGRGQCAYPWPSDFYTTPDADSATGLKVALPAAVLPRNTEDTPFPADDLVNAWPGFSANAQIRFALAQRIDAGPLPGQGDIGRSLLEESPIVLLRASTGERWPFFAEVDATAEDGEPQTIFVRPARRLPFGERFVVAIHNLRDGTGELIAPTPLFRALRDELPTDVPQLEAQRERYDAIFAELAAAEIDRATLQLAWEFTTNTEAAVQRDFVAMAPQIEQRAKAGDLGFTIEEIVEDPAAEVPLKIRGTFVVPSCLEGDAAPGAVFKRDGSGAPDCSGTAEAKMWIAVPKSVYEAQTPAQIVLYGHGLFGTGADAESIARKVGGAVVAGTDFWGMSEVDIGTMLTMLGDSFNGGRSIGDRLLQSAANFTTLGYLLQGELGQDPALAQFVDPSAVHYIGGSQGGIMGPTVTAMAPQVQRGILVVGGANYSMMVWRSVGFAPLNDVWRATQPKVQDREFLFALVQTVFDLADPLTYRTQIEAAGDRLLLIESIGDALVPNFASESMARSFGMAMAGPPIYSVWGIEEAPDLFEGSALLQVDTKMGPPPPVENLPPDGDNGAHGSAVDDPALLAAMELFLAKGIVDNQCEGACDPG